MTASSLSRLIYCVSDIILIYQLGFVMSANATYYLVGV